MWCSLLLFSSLEQRFDLQPRQLAPQGKGQSPIRLVGYLYFFLSLFWLFLLPSGYAHNRAQCVFCLDCPCQNTQGPATQNGVSRELVGELLPGARRARQLEWSGGEWVYSMYMRVCKEMLHPSPPPPPPLLTASSGRWLLPGSCCPWGWWRD